MEKRIINRMKWGRYKEHAKEHTSKEGWNMQ